MRDIRFRAWDKKENRMEYMGLMDLVYNCDTGTYAPNGDWESCHSLDGVEWMQYVGFKDRNGKEIYEGDIVKRRTIQTMDEFEEKIVEYDERIAGFWPLNMFVWNPKEIEIIGNIYLNPELLKGGETQT